MTPSPWEGAGDPPRGLARIRPSSSKGTTVWQAPLEQACRAQRSHMERGRNRERAFLTSMVGMRREGQ